VPCSDTIGEVRGSPSIRAAIAALGFAAAVSAAAQNAPLFGDKAPATPGPASAEDVQKEIEQFQTHAAEWSAKAEEYARAQRDAPAQIAQLDAEIARLRTPAQVSIPESDTLDQLEVRAIAAEQDLALAQRELAEQQSELDTRLERRRQLPQLLADAKARAMAPASAPPAAGDAAAVEAQGQLVAQRRAAFESEVSAYEQELLSYESRGRVLERQISLAQQRVAQAKARLGAIHSALAERRKAATMHAAESALDSIQEAQSLAPEVREAVRRLAEQNADLALVRTGETGVLQSIDDLTRKLAGIDQRLTEVDADFDRLSKKVAAGELTKTLGILLRKTRSQAPDVGKYRRFMRIRQGEIANVQARQEELRDELARLSDPDKAVAKATAPYTKEMAPADRARLEALMRDLLDTKRRHLRALLRDNELYFQKLVDFDAREQQLVDKTEQLLSFIDQRILWIPSGGAVPVRIASDTVDALRWLARPSYWIRAGRALFVSLSRTPVLALAAALSLLGALWLRRPMQHRLEHLAAQARPPTQTAILPTLEAIAIALAFAPWGPGLVAFFGWRLSVSPEATQFVRSLAHGLISAGVIWLTLEVPRQLVRRHGPAEAHFGWPHDAVRSLRRQIGSIAAIAVPLVLVIQLFEARGEEGWRESVGRLALIALLLSVTAFTHRIFREGGPLRAIVLDAQQVRLAPRTWRLGHVLALAVPIALAVSAARGYYWTALRLGESYHLTLVFTFVLFVALHLALRWTLLARRRLAFDQWRAAREAEREQRATAAETGERHVEPEPELDLGAVDEQTRRLLYTSAAVALLLGLWVLWADLVPALGVLNDVQLWNTTQTQTVQITSPDGTVQAHTEPRVVPITLGSLLVSLLLAFMTFVVVRNLPGLLEISLFRRLEMGPGERYAIASIAKYAITLIGGVLAFNAIGIGWSNVQWLVAAVGLGLGFGLQEIFANFVSGVILLFERPIRVGDTVTVGGTSGTVSKIRIRATLITAFDRKKLVVPNKELMTSSIVNWSLADTVQRVDIPISVAYGTDPEAALRKLVEVAKEHEHVLEDPKPRALLVGFGANTLNLELRVYSPDVEHVLMIRNDLNLGIERAFREAGIIIGPAPAAAAPAAPAPAAAQPPARDRAK
jgi:potassium-dependent mechanosensitive channel